MRKQITRITRRVLSSLFLSQVRTLANSTIPSCIQYKFESQRKEVLRVASLLCFEREEIPFIPVIPFTYRSFHDQIPMIEIDGKRGYNNTCDDACIWRNTKYQHREPYHIFKVSKGEPLNGQSISEQIAELNKAGRRPLYTEEVIALCLHIKPKTVSLYCHVPGSNPWSQRHLLTGPIDDGFDGSLPEYFKGPSVYGLVNDINSPRDKLHIPSCLI